MKEIELESYRKNASIHAEQQEGLQMMAIARVIRNFTEEPPGGNISPLGWVCIWGSIGIAILAAVCSLVEKVYTYMSSILGIGG